MNVEGNPRAKHLRKQQRNAGAHDSLRLGLRIVRSRGVRLTAGVFIYAAAFAALRQLGQLWSTDEFYSIWFPAAGLRFAVLWLFGTRITPLLVIGEVVAWAAFSSFRSTPIEPLPFIASVVCRCVGYGAAIHFSRRAKFRPATQAQNFQFTLAATTAPLAAFVLSVPWHIVAGEQGFGTSARHVAAQGILFFTGDLLGILLIAPLVLVVAQLIADRRIPRFRPWREWVEAVAIMLAAASLVIVIRFAGFGIRMLPLMFGAAIVGVRVGRNVAWAAVLITSVPILVMTAAHALDTDELSLHLQVAAVIAVGMLAAAYSDDQQRMRQELHSRDSALLHVERLRSLRAMSLAVIHELSQPLSTLSIETKYLAKLSRSPTTNADELRSVSELIAKKTDNVANMLRRLRSFGAAPGEHATVIKIEKLVRDVVAIVAPEASAAGVRIEMRLKKDLAVLGQEVELQQALLNLLRNAIASSPASTVRLGAEDCGQKIRIDIINRPAVKSPYRKGMGVGKLIVEAIADMHGGELKEHQNEIGEVIMSLFLPAPTAKKVRAT